MHRFIGLTLATALSAPVLAAIKHTRKPLPAGLDIRGPQRPGTAQLLVDLTFEAGGENTSRQQIFSTIEGVIQRAQKFLVLDMFLYNPNHSQGPGSYPALSQRLTDALLAKRAADPGVDIVLLTDPLNTFYGSLPQPQFRALEAAGVRVCQTRLDPLRDSNPLYSGLYRTYLRHLPALPGTLPNALLPGGPKVGLRSYLELLNFKANHRKVVVSESEAVVSSANPHDASAANSNLGLWVTGPVLADLLASERAVYELSGASSALFESFHRHLHLESDNPPLPPPAVGQRGGSGASVAQLQLLTESGIRSETLEVLATAGAGDRVLVGIFYLSDRRVIAGLKAAAGRGAQVEVILDRNLDAFGRKKSGLPAQPVAAELVAAGVQVRWYRTRGEQFHPKYLAVFTGDTFTLLAGSGNFTRRNIGAYNLETSLCLRTPAGSALAEEVAGMWRFIWSNEGGLCTSAYASDPLPAGLPGALRTLVYRLQEASGLSTF